MDGRDWYRCPMTWGYWTSPKIVAIKKTIYRSWLGDVKHGDMTNDPWAKMAKMAPPKGPEIKGPKSPGLENLN